MSRCPSLSKGLHCCGIISAGGNERCGFDAHFCQSTIRDLDKVVCGCSYSSKLLQTENNWKLWDLCSHAAVYTSLLSIFPSIHQIGKVISSFQAKEVSFKDAHFLHRQIALHEHVACSWSIRWPQTVNPFQAKVILCCRKWNISMYEKSRANFSTKWLRQDKSYDTLTSGHWLGLSQPPSSPVPGISPSPVW